MTATLFKYLGHIMAHPRGPILVGTRPKGGGGGTPLRTPQLLHGTMCFVGAGGAGDFVLGGVLARAVLKGRDFFFVKDRP